VSTAYPHVFSTIKVGPVELPNRIYLGPHGNPLSAGGVPSDDFAHYYAERAAGGVGLVLQSLPVLPVQVGRQCPLDESTVPSFAAVADLMHDNGARIFGQLQYWWGSGGQWEPLSPMRPVLGASSYQRFDHYSVTHQMSEHEIGRLVSAYGQCARNLRSAGYDGVEVHCAHGIIAEQFLSPYWNHRTDGYGGGVEGRLRFLREVLEAVRENIGPDMALGIRFNCDEMLPGGWTGADAMDLLGRIAAFGLIDFVDLDVAIEPNQFPLGMPNYQMSKFSNESFAARARAAVPELVAFSALGRVTSVADAERALAAGSTDVVGVVRGLLAEPALVRNAQEGHEDRSRTCIACNWCMDANGGAWGCAINPASTRERRWGRATTGTADNAERVVVVGGGPGGLEAARVAAERGHDVVLLEREERLGGQYVQWSSLPGRESHYDAIEFYARELPRLGVEVRTGVEATADGVLSEGPGAVIVATGSRYVATGESGFMPAPIPGHDQDFVYSPHDILEGGARPKGNVLVLDDEALSTGAGIAEILAKDGAEVEFMTRWLHVAHNLFGTFEFPVVVALLKSLGVRLSPQTYVQEIRPGEVTVFDVLTNATEVRAGIDAVVLVTMRKPVATLVEELDGEVDQLFAIGDALAPRGHGEAFYEGSFFARKIGVADAPRTFADAYFRAADPASFPRRAQDIEPISQAS
jgi:2,4-dienoyl-CoA reductase-like NADH-dependent reductase (Old Yellow Enzyme family)